MQLMKQGNRTEMHCITKIGNTEQGHAPGGSQNYVLCPVCGRGRIFSEEKDSDDVPLRLVLPGSRQKARWYVKCDVCKNQIGITARK